MWLDRAPENLPMIYLEAFSYFNGFDGGLGQVQSSYKFDSRNLKIITWYFMTYTC